jgi:D-beta-D-heptose 7-phosphate kinase/D-beta-D-heptose 1-phosphate adenosyltransferase
LKSDHGSVVVLADGCFDPLHLGHIRYLEAARAYGKVCVRVAPDAAIVAKGRTPFQSQHERVETIKALKMVDRVVSDETLAGAITRLWPKMLVKGWDWKGKIPVDVFDACVFVGAQIGYLQAVHRTSSERLAG